MWLLMVASLRYSLPAISAFDRPWADEPNDTKFTFAEAPGRLGLESAG